MKYNESPPILSIEKEFVDDMVNELITLIGNRELLFSKVFSVEQITPSGHTYETIEELYGMLEDTDDDMTQVCNALNVKMKY